MTAAFPRLDIAGGRITGCGTKRDPALNVDLWQRLLALCEQHKVTFQWIRGHAGHPENERCDHLAVRALKQANLPFDLPAP